LEHPRKWPEVVAIWTIVAVLGTAIVVTYSRLPASDFYHVSRSGVAGGASRVLVLTNFPVAFVAIALLGFAVSGLIGSVPSSTARRQWIVTGTAVIALLLCLVAAIPGVLDQGDLDARLVNALPALGVALVLGLSLLSMQRGAHASPVSWSRGDVAGLAFIAMLTFLALPWLLADAGAYIGDVPGLGQLFMSKEFAEPNPDLRAVHLGHHHGVDGLLFVTTAFLLRRRLHQIDPSRLRSAMSWYLAFMLAYGVANFANDFWLEQLVKRGTTTHEIPSMLRPEVSPSWGLLLIGTVAGRFLLFRPRHSSDTVTVGSSDATGTGASLAPFTSRLP
jgi:hypothetical protein